MLGIKRRIRSVKSMVESVCDVVNDMLSLQESIYSCGPGVQGCNGMCS